MSSTAALSKRELRQQLRARRRALSVAAQRRAVQRLQQQLARLRCWRQAHHIGIYLSGDGEVAAEQLARLAVSRGKKLYCPVVQAERKLLFCRYRPRQPLQRNRYGIGEPRAGRPRRPAQLDLILVPATGLDRQGRRLGMGGGFYDSSLAFRQRRPGYPRLIALAHRCQQVDNLPVSDHDLIMDQVLLV